MNKNNNFNNAFRSNVPMINHQNNKNQNNIIHNNIGENITYDHITEYTIHINSVDRDISIYPNQFKFSVHFGDVTKPNISKRFSNIRYIKLENVILPESYKIDTSFNDPSGTNIDPSGNVISSNQNYITTNKRYILLKMKELSNERVYSTGDSVRSDTIKLYYDVKLNQYCNSWATNQNSFQYTNGNLGNIKKLTFELFDGDGNQILFLCNNSSPNVPVSYLNNPLNVNNQMEISLVFGIIENDLNTLPNFEK